MKKLLLVQFCLIFCTLYSQTNRFIYELTIKKSDENISTTNMVLDVNMDKNEVKFYDYDFLVTDSLRQHKKDRMHNSQSYQVIKRKINGKKNALYRNHVYDYFKITSNDEIVWKIEGETKTIDKIVLNKATTNFGGRKWTAWFYPQIAIQEGPYKFNGLPGLILEISDTNHTFHYSMVKHTTVKDNTNTHDFVETFYGKRPIAVSLEQFQKVKLNYYHNIIKIMDDFSKKGVSIAYDKALRESTLQKSIRDHYFPIEIDKAIVYPEK